MRSRDRERLGDALAAAALDGAWTEGAIAGRVGRALALPTPEARSTARWILRRRTEPPARAVLAAALAIGLGRAEDGAPDALLRALDPSREAGAPVVRRWHVPPDAFVAPGFAPVPSIASETELAELLGIGPAELSFLAGPHLDVRTRPAALAHYAYRWVPKPSGAHRLLEAPRPRLKAVQRRILDRILAAVPPHAAAHGFVKRRSARTFAALHAGSEVVVRVDLEDFFGSIGGPRVEAIFAALGYPPAVARSLARLSCHRPPREILASAPPGGRDGERAWRSRRRLDRPHLPQGAPTSPALANLAAYGLDVRMSALARRLDATYARYADDLALSGPASLLGARRSLLGAMTSIANDEGFAVRFDKTRVMTAASRQEVVGLVVNQSPDVRRDAYDALRARLHAVACRRNVPTEPGARQALADELRGHVAWASGRLHRARKLAALLEAALARLENG
jgi:hypothetical protein